MIINVPQRWIGKKSWVFKGSFVLEIIRILLWSFSRIFCASDEFNIHSLDSWTSTFFAPIYSNNNPSSSFSRYESRPASNVSFLPYITASAEKNRLEVTYYPKICINIVNIRRTHIQRVPYPPYTIRTAGSSISCSLQDTVKSDSPVPYHSRLDSLPSALYTRAHQNTEKYSKTISSYVMSTNGDVKLKYGKYIILGFQIRVSRSLRPRKLHSSD